MTFVKHRWRSKWTALLVAGALLTSIISPALPAARAEEAASAARTVQYSDLASSYAAKEIAALTASGILDGFDDGTFRPAEPVTRAQFAKVIASILKLKPEPDIANRFRDVPANAWYAGYTGALVKEGITDGVSEHEFAPDQLVTREELAAFFMRALKLSKSAQSLPLDSSIFADFNDISPWAQQYVSFAYKIGLLQGSSDANNSLVYRPKAQADRQALARLAFELQENKDTYLDKAAGLTPAASVSPTPSPSPSTGFMGGGGGFGGGGGSGGGTTPSPTPSATPTPAPADGSTLTDLPAGNYTGSFTVAAGSTMFGPETGTASISGTLTVNPGQSGEVTLRNIQAANLQVLSGSDHSIILQGVKISGTLTVNTGSQDTPVRILAQEGTSIVQTLLESEAILEISAGSAGDVTIGDSAGGKTIELRGSINGTVRSQAPGAHILVRDGASIHSLIMEANGRVQADGNVSGYGILNSNIQVELSGTHLAVLKENTGSAAAASIQALGDASNLTLKQMNKVLEARSQYNALKALGLADGFPGPLKQQLEAAQAQIKTLSKAQAEKMLGELPAYENFNWSDRASLEPQLVAVQQAVDIAVSWGNVDGELTGYQNWRYLKELFSFSYLSLSIQMIEGNIAVAGTSVPRTLVSLDKIVESPEIKVIHLGETLTDDDGNFLYMDNFHFPLKVGEIISFTVSNPETGYSTQRIYTVSASSSKTELPPVNKTYYEGDPLEFDYGINFADYQYLLILNQNKEVLYSGMTFAYNKLSLYFDGPVKPIPGETLTVYAQGQYNYRAVSDPVRVKVLANSGDSQQPVLSEVYDGDFMITVPAPESAHVTVERSGQILRPIGNYNGIVLFQLTQEPLKQGEQITVISKEPGKYPSISVTKQVLPTSGKSMQPAATLTEGDATVTIFGKFPSDSSLLIRWGESSTSPAMVFPLGSSPDGIFNFHMNFSTDYMYDESVYLFLKSPGKGISTAQKLVFTPKTKLLSSGGTLFTDSVNLKVTAEPGALVSLKKQDGTIVYEKRGTMDSKVILLDSMHLKQTLWDGEAVQLTATAPGKKPSDPETLYVTSNQQKTAIPVVAGTLVRGMEKPVLSILSQVYKFEAFIETPQGVEVSVDELSPRTEFGLDKQFTLNPQLIKDATKLLVSIKEHGKEKSDPVEVPIYDASQSTFLQTVTQTVYQSTNDWEFINGYADPFSTVTAQTADGQTIAHGQATILGSFRLDVPHSILVPDTLLHLTAKAPGLPNSNTVTLAVYAAQGETSKPIAADSVESGGTMIKLDVEAPAGSFVTIYNQDGSLLDSGYWKGEAGSGMVKNTIYFDVGRLDQTLRITAQLPGRNVSENTWVHVQTSKMPENMFFPAITKTQFDYPSGMTKISGHTEDPFTLIRGGVVKTNSDANGNFELYVPTIPGFVKSVEFQAPGKKSVTYPLYMMLETPYMYEQSNSGGSVGGGGGGSVGISPGPVGSGGGSEATNP